MTTSSLPFAIACLYYSGIGASKLGMHHFRRRFLKSFHAPKAEKAEDKPRLPTELLIIIVSYVEKKEYLASLCRSSRTFKDICIPVLYSTIDINMGTAHPSHVVLYKTLKTPIYSRVVTHFSIYLIPDDKCPLEGQVSVRRFDNCTCDAYDRVLGNALICLNNLQSLTIKCRLCNGEGHTHDYLFQLDAPMLRQFVFQCYRSLSTSNGSILLLPFISNVTALTLECDAHLIGPIPTGTYDALIARTNVAPHLHTMNCSYDRFSTDLLASRPIQRLCIDTFKYPPFGRRMANLDRAISQSPGELSHLFMSNLFQWLPFAMVLDPNPYRHLKFVGTISIILDREETTYEEMEALRPLATLEAIEVGIASTPQRSLFIREAPTSMQYASNALFDPGQPFEQLLEERHPLLRRVLLIPRDKHSSPRADLTSVLWEKRDAWESRKVPYLGYWDLLCDKLDRV